MRLKVIVHDAEEGGYWAEIPAITGCATQGNTIKEFLISEDHIVYSMSWTPHIGQLRAPPPLWYNPPTSPLWINVPGLNGM